MKRHLFVVAALAATLALGAATAALATHATQTETHVVPFTVGTVTGQLTLTDQDSLPHETVTTTVTVTETAPPATTTEPPATAAADCTKTLDAGGDLSTFLSSLVPGDVGCLRGGTYEDGCTIPMAQDASAGSRIVVRSFPGEQAVLRTNISLVGDFITLRDVAVTGLRRCAETVDGVNLSGTGQEVVRVDISDTNRHGVLVHTSARDALIARNFVSDVGTPGSTLTHGAYVQGSGHTVVSNVFTQLRGGYGIQLYTSPSDITVAQNTVTHSEVRAGIVVDTSGSGVTVSNNVLTHNATNGITYKSCGGACVVDNNLVFANGGAGVGGALAGSATGTISADPQYADGEFRVAASSPAVDQAQGAHSTYEDRDGVSRPQGGGPDLGAYER